MHSKIFDVASEKFSNKLKNIKPEDIDKVITGISKGFKSIKSNVGGKMKKDSGFSELSLEMNSPKSSESVFFDCDTAPPKPQRQPSQAPLPPARLKTGKHHRSGSLVTTKLERESLLGSSRLSLSTWPQKGHISNMQNEFDKHLLLGSKSRERIESENEFKYQDNNSGKPDQADSADQKDDDIEVVKKPANAQSDFSNFVQKKSIAQGMMDLALVSANTNQLRYVMDMDHNHPYYATSLTLIISSLIMQVAVGLAMLYTNRFNIRKQNEMKRADRINNLSVIGVFMITLINVFISTFNGSQAIPVQVVAPPTNSTLSCPVCPGLGPELEVFVDG